MSNSPYLLSLTFPLIFLSLFVFSCDNSTESTIHPLVGGWVWIETTNNEVTEVPSGLENETITFNEDETLVHTSVTSTGESSTLSGTWSTNQNILTLYIHFEFIIEEYSISDTTLILTRIENGITTNRISKFSKISS